MSDYNPALGRQTDTAQSGFKLLAICIGVLMFMAVATTVFYQITNIFGIFLDDAMRMYRVASGITIFIDAGAAMVGAVGAFMLTRTHGGRLTTVASVAVLLLVLTALLPIARFFAQEPMSDPTQLVAALSVVSRVVVVLMPPALFILGDLHRFDRPRWGIAAALGAVAAIATWGFYLLVTFGPSSIFSSPFITIISLASTALHLGVLGVVLFVSLLPAMRHSDENPGAIGQGSAIEGGRQPLRGWGNLIMGLFMIGGAASGQLVLKGTDSSAALAVLGAVLMGWGLFRLIQTGTPPRQ